MADKFTRPFVEAGMVVHWWQGGNTDGPPTAAIVTQVGDRTVDLAAISPGYSNFHVRAGVCHAGDPDLARGNRGEMGRWRHTPFNLRVMAVVAELEPAGKVLG